MDTDSSTAGKIPLLPAVGAAQMRPIEAFTSLPDSAIAISSLRNGPQMLCLPAYSCWQLACPSMSPSTMVELLPGLMTAAIGEIAQQHPDLPVIAGGLIKTKADVLAALSAGAAAVSSSNEQVWFM